MGSPWAAKSSRTIPPAVSWPRKKGKQRLSDCQKHSLWQLFGLELMDLTSPSPLKGSKVLLVREGPHCLKPNVPIIRKGEILHPWFWVFSLFLKCVFRILYLRTLYHFHPSANSSCSLANSDFLIIVIGICVFYVCMYSMYVCISPIESI